MASLLTPARLTDAISAFRNAAEQLPVSEDQAIARLKLGDCHYILTNYPGAMTNYWLVATNYSKLPSVSEALAPRALHQLVRVGIASGDMEQATRAMGLVLEEYSESPFGSQSMLAYGQALMQRPQTMHFLSRNLIFRLTGSTTKAPLGQTVTQAPQ